MDAMNCDRLFVEIQNDDGLAVKCPVQSLCVAFLAAYCDSNSVEIILVSKETTKKLPSIHLNALKGYQMYRSSYQSIPEVVQQCTLPAILSTDGCSVRSGLCGIMRHMVQLAQRKKSELLHEKLLGYKEMCLKQCAEVSGWTNFCELELPNLVSHLCQFYEWNLHTDILPVVMKFENHLSRPPVIHNINKLRDEAIRNAAKKLQSGDPSEVDVNSLPELQHLFAEGPNMTLTDLLLYPCIYYILSTVQKDQKSISSILHHCPQVSKWVERMRSQPRVKHAMSACNFEELPALDGFEIVQRYVNELALGVQHLDIRDHSSKKVKAWPSHMNKIMEKMQDVRINAQEDSHPAGNQLSLNWDKLPDAVNPREGDLPKKRVQRKCEQLENLVAAARLIAHPGDTIVDFCAGGGHVGILVAYLLPSCKVILVENKEESIRRARLRIATLKLENIVTYQCNMDYFTGNFNIGMCLHACGVATDQVLQRCIDKGADFVICPCCYGAIRDTQNIKYPRSNTYRNCSVSYQEYLVMGHAADQTQFNIPLASQGKRCMLQIDKDRALLAEECGYQVTLCSLYPLTCSPKNNLIVGTRERDK